MTVALLLPLTYTLDPTAARVEREFRHASPLLGCRFDPSGRFLLWNKNLENVLGMSAEEIADSHTLALYDEADRDKIRQVTKQVFATGASTNPFSHNRQRVFPTRWTRPVKSGESR